MRSSSKRWLKRIAIAGACASTIGLLLAQRAWAELGKQALAAGPELEHWADSLGGGMPATTVELNGHRMHLASITTALSMDEVLTRARALCRSEAGALQDELPVFERAYTEDESDLLMGILREQTERMGTVACLARGHSGGLHDLVGRIEAFARSGDVSQLGQLRYVFARTTDVGRTHALVVWNEGALYPSRMFPSVGDAAGSDFADLPRPRDATRVLSAQVEGHAYGVAVYELRHAVPARALADYQADLQNEGFRAVHLQPASEAFESRAFVRDAAPLQVHAFVQGGRAVLAVVRMGGASHRTFSAAR